MASIVTYPIGIVTPKIGAVIETGGGMMIVGVNGTVMNGDVVTVSMIGITEIGASAGIDRLTNDLLINFCMKKTRMPS